MGRLNDGDDGTTQRAVKSDPGLQTLQPFLPIAPPRPGRTRRLRPGFGARVFLAEGNSVADMTHPLPGTGPAARQPPPGLAATGASPAWTANRLLAGLAPEDVARWSPHLRALDLPAGHVLVAPRGKPRHVYFPTTAIVSLVHVQEDGSTVEVAVTGREGFVGVPLVTGGDVMPYQALMQTPGQVWQLPVELLRAEVARGGPVLRHLLLFVQALFTQVSQTAVCNRHHSLEQHLCRWLLLMFDRLDDRQLAMTQEAISTMLGVRRETVTEAAGALQAAGLIRYARGRIDLVDRRGLEGRACECHAFVAQEYRRLLG